MPKDSRPIQETA